MLKEKFFFSIDVNVGGGIAGQQQQQSQQNREINAQYGPGPSLRPQSTFMNNFVLRLISH